MRCRLKIQSTRGWSDQYFDFPTAPELSRSESYEELTATTVYPSYTAAWLYMEYAGETPAKVYQKLMASFSSAALASR